jgi:hypothetical protein
MTETTTVPEFDGFDWSGGNAEKNWDRHQVTPLETEQVFFNAEYGDYKISVDINTGVIDRRFSPRALGAVMEWYELNKERLLEDWQLAENHLSLKKIPPLE